ncbi:hypothetical protein M422DRAFT_263595 [Sphaerobolus stellatus SS14]|uniref:Methyltransferase n=1 Tax=Sphaerobolus stellatus (strain SS14) TaxID=990650 RepID=A0A0C9VAB4_SPHS4|nr:hypothetical protein M422DRAFT_263595 [Sphaerobolus stellatus SS14]
MSSTHGLSLCIVHILCETITLLKSGGWLIINDVRNGLRDPNGLGPGNDALWRIILDNMRSKQMDPYIVSKVQGILEASKEFEGINTQHFAAPVSKWNDPQTDYRTRRVGFAIRSSILRALHTMTNLGVTPQIMQDVRKEMDESWRNMVMDVSLIWARKR